MKSEIKLIKVKPAGYFLVVENGLVENQLALTEEEIPLVYRAVKKLARKLLRKTQNPKKGE